MVNIPDAYKVGYFNHKVDQITGYVTRSVLCLPLYKAYEAGRAPANTTSTPLGVVQFINKLAPPEGEEDDEVIMEDLGEDGMLLPAKASSCAVAEDLLVRRNQNLKENIRVIPFSKNDEELAFGFGKIASKAIGTAIDHDESTASQEQAKEEALVEEKKANFQSHVESIFDFFESRLDYGAEAKKGVGMEARHTMFKRNQREGELSIKMNAMIRGYLVRRKFEKRMLKNDMISRGITNQAREKAFTMRAKLRDAEKLRKRAFATQQMQRKQKMRDHARAMEACEAAMRADADRAVDSARDKLAADAAYASAYALLREIDSSFAAEEDANSEERAAARAAISLCRDAEDAREAIRSRPRLPPPPASFFFYARNPLYRPCGKHGAVRTGAAGSPGDGSPPDPVRVAAARVRGRVAVDPFARGGRVRARPAADEGAQIGQGQDAVRRRVYAGR